MLRRLRRWREDRRLAALLVPESLWQEALAHWPAARRYQGDMQQQWRDMALRFLLRKSFVSGAGFEITDVVRLRISLMATLPVLGLGLDWYRRFDTLVVYETPFIPGHEQYDELGLVVSQAEPLSGEAWHDGLVILSWEDISTPSQAGFAHNVVIHEMAHQLDMLHDGANGAPPLHADMDPARWHDLFTEAWDDLGQRAERGRDMPVDPYGLEDAGEFFSVVCEAFFENPDGLRDCWPALYAELRRFFRQDPAAGQLEP